MQFNWSLPYRIPKDERVMAQFPNAKAITTFLLSAAMQARFGQSGMNRTETRLWGAIQDAQLDMDAGTLDESAVLEISRDGIQFLYDTVDKWQPQPGVASWSLVLLDALKAALDRKDA
jgi:hypothetical protein